MKHVLYFLIIIVVVSVGCRERYEAPISYPNTGYLVVEGFINSGQGATNFHLSRTVKISDTVTIRNESGAQLNVEGTDNSNFPLIDNGAGMYSCKQLNLNSGTKYRLRIKTNNGKEYLSDFALPIKTPPIDSISWTREPNGIQLNINTHDPLNKTRYYNWNFEETWEFRSSFYRSLKWVKDPVSGTIIGVAYIYPNGQLDTTVFRCWQHNNSTSILTGTSAKLSQDIIHLPLIFIEEHSWKLSVLYSVKLYQHGVSASGYEFLRRMKKNTEQVGSIFDSQPSELNSNIHSTGNPQEPVIGFIDVADAQEKGLFIYASDVRNWTVFLDCHSDVWDRSQNLDSLYRSTGFIPTTPTGFTGIGVARPICVDCTLRGTNERPSFWPN